MVKKDLKRTSMVCLGLLLVAAKLFLSYTQYATIYPPLAPLDDDLMFRAAQSITQGNWLGDYGYLTLSKHMFFSIWLAFLHQLKVPYLVGNMALWALASWFVSLAVAPVLKSNWAKLLVFTALLYNPAVSAQFATRIYRDSIFPALCTMFFAAVIAIGLRYHKQVSAWFGWLCLMGLSFGAVYLSREDGFWVLPFGAVALLIVIWVNFKQRDPQIVKKLCSFLLPLVVASGVIAGYCWMNYQHYGRFIISDFSQKEFKAAYGALTSLKQENWHPMVAVPQDVRQAVYQQVPVFAPVEEALKEPLLVNGFKNQAIGDFTSGSFYWALRTALANLGVYETPQKAQQYLEILTAQIQSAVDQGRLETQNGSKKLRVSLTPPIKLQYVPKVFLEGMHSFKVALLFEQCNPLAYRAVGTQEEIQPVEDFIYQKGGTVLKANSEEIYLSPIRKLTHGFLSVLAVFYKIAIPLFFVVGVFWQIKQIKFDLFQNKFTLCTMLNWVMLGLVGMALLRCAMIAFVEVSSFGIGTYAMYLSTVHPLLILYGILGFIKTFEY